MKTVCFATNAAARGQIAEHLLLCDSRFGPPLSTRVDIADYAGKIVSQATRFEAWCGDSLVGLVAAYANDQVRRIAFITSVSVLEEWTGRGIATRLMHDCIDYAKLGRALQIRLEVATGNESAIRLYRKCGFAAAEARDSLLDMHLDLQSVDRQ